VTAITQIVSYTIVKSSLISMLLTQIEYPIWFTDYIYLPRPTQRAEVQSEGLALKSVICIVVASILGAGCAAGAGVVFWRRKAKEKRRLRKEARHLAAIEEQSQEGSDGVSSGSEESDDPFQDNWTCDLEDFEGRLWQMTGDGGNLQGN
jgi:hypothetical protein